MTPTPLLKIGYVTKRYPRFSETFIVNEILALEAAGLEIEIFSLYPPNDTHFQDTISQVRAPVISLAAEGLKVIEFWSELEMAAAENSGFWNALEASRGAEAREVYQAARLARLVRQRHIAHLHAHFATTATSVARLASHFAQVPYSFTAHAKDIFHECVVPADLERKLAKAAAVITVSDYNVEFLRKVYGPAANRVCRLYNGLHLDRFVYQNPQDRQDRIVAVGRLVEKKGFEVLIEACASLARRGQTFTCEIIGEGEREAQLRALIEQHQLRSRVQMLGARPQSEVIKRVQSAVVLAAPCVVGQDGNADGLPTVLLEAMALGTPCVSTDVTGIPEVVRHEKNGLLVPQHDAEALANAIERLLNDRPLRVQLADQARRLIEAEFDSHRNAARLLEVFRSATRSAAGKDAVSPP
jgi:glycosyltransferase involved in cell wall biosynthesis